MRPEPWGTEGRDVVSCQRAGKAEHSTPVRAPGPRHTQERGPGLGEGGEAGLPGHPGPRNHSLGTVTMPADPTAQTALSRVP